MLRDRAWRHNEGATAYEIAPFSSRPPAARPAPISVVNLDSPEIVEEIFRPASTFEDASLNLCAHRKWSSKAHSYRRSSLEGSQPSIHPRHASFDPMGHRGFVYLFGINVRKDDTGTHIEPSLYTVKMPQARGELFVTPERVGGAEGDAAFGCQYPIGAVSGIPRRRAMSISWSEYPSAGNVFFPPVKRGANRHAHRSNG